MQEKRRTLKNLMFAPIKGKKTNGEESRCRQAVAAPPFQEATPLLKAGIFTVAQIAIILRKCQEDQIGTIPKRKLIHYRVRLPDQMQVLTKIYLCPN
jgi:hypothetical protein